MSNFVWPVRVYWEDTDAGGVVYYANYLKFLERARSEWLRALGVAQTDLAREHGVMFVVRRVEADYLRPAHFDDHLEVVCTLEALGRASLTMAQEVRRGAQTLLAARVKIACVERSVFRPVRIPDPVLERLAG